jgi:hypothetical protein
MEDLTDKVCWETKKYQGGLKKRREGKESGEKKE